MISMNLTKPRKRFEKKHNLKGKRLYEFVSMIATFFIVCIGLILFRAESMGQAWVYFCGIWKRGLFTSPEISGSSALIMNILVMLLVEWLQREKSHALDLSSIKRSFVRWTVYLSVLFLLFAFGGNAVNFMYFQF